MPLTPFELAMVVDDRPGYSKVAALELDFSGPLDVDTLRSALTHAVSRHPMLHARLERLPRGRLQWVLPPEAASCVPLVTVAAQDDPAVGDSPLSESIDLFTEGGVRFGIVVADRAVTVRIEVHHACTDGMGLAELVEDILVLYEVKTTKGTPTVALRDLRQDRLRLRGRLASPGSGQASSIDTTLGLRLAYRFVAEAPDPLRPGTPDVELSPKETEWRADEEASDLLGPLRRAAARQHATLNDLLIRDLLLTVQSWNRPAAASDHAERYRVMVPSDLRTADHAAMSAANGMSFAFLTRRTGDLTDRDELLMSISGETRFIRAESPSWYFLRAVQLASHWPRVMRRVAAARWCLATVLLSNLGDPSRAFHAGFRRVKGKIAVGDVVLEWIRARPPLRPLTRLGLVVNTYANQLSLGTTVDRTVLGARDVSRFLTMYRAHLHTSANRGDSRV
jgi:hypothetical protein